VEKLNFPVFKEPLPGPPILSMDNYVKFVEFWRRSVMNRKAYEEERKKSIVDVRFILK